MLVMCRVTELFKRVRLLHQKLQFLLEGCLGNSGKSIADEQGKINTSCVERGSADTLVCEGIHRGRQECLPYPLQCVMHRVFKMSRFLAVDGVDCRKGKNL